MSRKLEVTIVGDARGLQRAFGQAGKAGDGLGRRLSRGAGKGLVAVGKGALIAGGAIGVGLVAALGLGVKGFMEEEKASAQTAAALKSTGNAANTSLKAVESMADSLEKMSGADKAAIQSGANLLLTFTNVRNEVGKGNDIYNQATRTMLDMSTALGQDTKSSAVQLGKALNDPIKGITALSRVGVSFTQGQKDQIKAMVEAGDTMGAQKLILAELNKEFGGSAKAAGETFGGQLNILKARLGDVAENIAGRLIPHLMSLLTWANTHWPAFEAAITQVVNRIVAWFQANWPTIQAVALGTFEALKSAWENVLQPALAAISAGVEWLVGQAQTHWPKIQKAAADVLEWYNAHLKPAIEAVVSFIAAVWERYGAEISATVTAAFGVVKTVITTTMAVVKGLIEAALAVISGDWSGAWNALKGVASTALTGAVEVIRGVVDTVKEAAKAVGTAAIDGIEAGLAKIGEKVKGKLGDAKDAITNFDPSEAASDLGGKIVDGIMSGLATLGGKVTSLVRDALNAPIKAFNGLKIPRAELSVSIPGVGPFGGAKIGFGAGPYDLPDLPTFDDGGVMPGPRGKHSLAWVAGGETILPTHRDPAPAPVVHHHWNLPQGVTDPDAIAASLEWRMRSVS
jgi:hypothetical protein